MKRKNTRRGFTLIELLVVVLIIGILTAVAVPQYKKAVYKSRYNALKPLVKALADAEEVYYLANNNYAAIIEELDIDFPETPTKVEIDANNDYVYSFPWGYCFFQINLDIKRISCKNTESNLLYGKVLQNLKKYTTYAGMQKCNNGTGIGKQICQQESGLTQSNHPVAGNELNSYYW